MIIASNQDLNKWNDSVPGDVLCVENPFMNNLEPVSRQFGMKFMGH